MYKSLNSHIFRTATEIESNQDVFDELWFIVTFSTILVVTELLCSFRLVLGGKTGKVIPVSSILELLEMFLANSFALSDAEDNTSRLLNRGGIADLPLLRTLLAMYQKPQEPSFREVLRLFCFIRIWKFWSIKNSFAVITNRAYKYQTHFWGFVKTDHLLTLSQNFTSNSRSTEAKNNPLWNIAQMIKKTANQHEKSQKLCDEAGFICRDQDGLWRKRGGGVTLCAMTGLFFVDYLSFYEQGKYLQILCFQEKWSIFIFSIETLSYHLTLLS